MHESPLLILGSARKNGDSHKLTNILFEGINVIKADLLDYKLYSYSYLHDYPSDDDFEKLLNLMLAHKKLVFVTPVYWYAMSGLMKNFFDRLTDIVTVNKSIGRQLKDKETFLVAIGTDKDLPAGFEEPFRLTSIYFDMHYKGAYYCTPQELKSMTGKCEFLNGIRSLPKAIK